MDSLQARILDEAYYIISRRCTIRQAAEHFGISKSTIHTDMQRKLKLLDQKLYEQTKVVLDFNMSVRHLRGGESTRTRYLRSNVQKSHTGMPKG